MRPPFPSARFLGQARTRRAIVSLLVLALFLLPLLPSIHDVHGASPLVFQAIFGSDGCGVGGCALGSGITIQNGDVFVVFFLSAAGCSPAATFASSPTETWTQTQGVGGYQIWTATAHSTSVYTLTETCASTPGGSSMWAMIFRGTFNGFGAATFNSPSGQASDTINLNVGAGSMIVETANVNAATCTGVSISTSSGQTSRQAACNSNNSPSDFAYNVLTSGPTVGAGTLPLTVSANGGNVAHHSALELTSVQPSGTIGTTTACYGNCGTPPITLVNANATHTVPFNQSLTLFYEFQAQGNGFLQNVTVNVAKSYTNGQRVTLGVYTTSSSCPSSVTPFSIQCPAILVQSLSGVVNPTKGRITLGGLQIQFQSGQVGGLAVSGLFTGLDLNQTNASCGTAGAGFCTNPPGMLQTPGSMPSTITTYSTPPQASISSTGLWGFIVSAISPSQPVPGISGPCASNFAQLDCLLPNLVNSFCNTITAACQTGSSFLWISVLTLITFASLMVILSTLFPNLNPRGFFVGEFLIMIFIGWFVTFAGLGLLPSFMIVLFFFIISWLFIGKVKGTGPI